MITITMEVPIKDNVLRLHHREEEPTQVRLATHGGNPSLYPAGVLRLRLQQPQPLRQLHRLLVIGDDTTIEESSRVPLRRAQLHPLLPQQQLLLPLEIERGVIRSQAMAPTIRV